MFLGRCGRTDLFGGDVDAQRSSLTVNCCGIGAGPVGGLGGFGGMGQDACLHIQCQDGFVCQQGRCQPQGGGGEQPPGGGPGGPPAW